jgi:hypothetical protein
MKISIIMSVIGNGENNVNNNNINNENNGAGGVSLAAISAWRNGNQSIIINNASAAISQ